ncbi:unnamed protein product [Spodoptera littoralis]|uniref:Uncharacterized protein n=1 Tax=Spodoptera littoralis TaxID=7109 RepID=A0A9P0I7F1_SPOLI|nr:unnamed protein product [Spodoptera littoralis]CAH1641598.1 unnamed protein product [Spodoptera littoralis]
MNDHMEALTMILMCGDGTCCCIPRRSMIALIAIISLVACLLDMLTSEKASQFPENCTLIRTEIECAKQLLMTLFQMANLLLLLASIVESAILVQLYVWYTLAFVVMGLIVNIVDFLFKYKVEGTSCLLGFITEVCFLFVIFRCLPLVDTYRKHISGDSDLTS